MAPTIRTILFCTQLGPRAAHIFQYAYLLAERLGAKIVVLHVRSVLDTEQEAMVEGYTGKGSVHSLVDRDEHETEVAIEQRIEKYFADEASVTNWHDVVDRIVVAEGRARDEILKQVEAVDADLVVVGAHRHRLMDLLLGRTTAHKLIEGSRVPVVVVPVPES